MTAPAIRTAYDERYSLRTDGSKPAGDPEDRPSEIDHIETVGSHTRFHRGFGETGTRVELVDMSDSVHDGCPRCGETEMVLSLDLNPEGYDDAVFYCTNLKCPHFVGDEVEHDMDKIRADKPEVWDNTAICPECDTRFTTQLRRGLHERHEFVHPSDGDTTANRADSVEYVEGNAHDGGIVGDVLCDDCTPNSIPEAEA